MNLSSEKGGPLCQFGGVKGTSEKTNKDRLTSEQRSRRLLLLIVQSVKKH